MSKRSRWLAGLGLGIWLVAGTAVGGVLLIRHMVALPVPDTGDTGLRDAIRALLPAPTWRAVHVMYRACPCSQRTITHLTAGLRPRDLQELVVMIDDHGRPGPEDDRLRAAGFAVVVLTPMQLQTELHLEAAPVLVVMSARGELAYVGGYNRHKQSAAYEDTAIIADLRADRIAPELPVFGCATSARLARIVDPLHLAPGPQDTP